MLAGADGQRGVSGDAVRRRLRLFQLLFDKLASPRRALGPSSLVVEVAANDGYLLQYAKARGIPALGIEPTAGTAAAARAKDIDIIEEFFFAPVSQ